MIIETCPKCGHDLMSLVLTSYPPIHKKECHNCGWSWSKTEEIVRVPFNEDKINIEGFNYPDFFNNNNFEKSACINCPSNPKNGGNGICFCTLGQQVIY